ncbi:MAG: SdrD B-like domain-containing protein [Pseudomonadota bacterium]|nr:SdrD B-like domain-containing protein [Pseudomonadota bacterium]
MPQPPVISIKVTYPGSLLNPSFVDITVLSNSPFGLSVFDGWCADRDITLDLASVGGGNYASSTLQASVYSTYELGILGAAIPTIGLPGNLDLVNWLLNQNFNVNGYTMGEVQGAIWTLLGDSYASSTIIYPRDPAKITQLINLANQHDGYVPDITDSDTTNDKIAVMLFPRKADGTAQQPLLIQTQSAALGDRVWHDSDGNGQQDAGEVGVQGVTVKLWRDLNDNSTVDANEVLASTITDASGYYKFVGLTPGLQYQLQFMQPNGYSGFTIKDAVGDTVDSDVNSYGITAAITLAPGVFNTSIDAGLVQRARLGDTIWEDSNANGQQDAGETGLAGVTVQLKDANGNVIATQTTDGSGNYGFDVLPGTYSVAVIPPAGYSITPTDLGNDLSDSDIDGNGMTGQTTLASGETNNSVDGGLYRKAELGDRVWLDSNGNGQQDAGELGIANVTVNLKDGNGNVIATQSTDANGNYLFTDLTPGTYSVAFVAPAGYEFTQQDQGADAADSDADTLTGATIQTVLDSGESDRTWDAGLVQPSASIGDKVWFDFNKNGVQDSGEFGVQGVLAKLVNAGGNVIATQSTDSNGDYLFSNLTPGDYRVDFDLSTLPTGYTVTSQNLGGNDALDSDANVLTGQTTYTTLDAGEIDRTWDMGIKADVGIDIEKYVRGEYMEGGSSGGEGHTPGYWKNHTSGKKGADSEWVKTGYSPSDSYESIFGVNVSGNPTLLDALKAKGGGENALMRHSASALLNAAHPYIDYLYSSADVISMTQAAISSGDYETTKDLFDVQNNLGADMTTLAGTSTLVVTPDYDADTPLGLYIPIGGQAVFTYVVTNTGDVALSNVQVSDDRLADLVFVGGDLDNDGMLDTNETWTFTASETVTTAGLHLNIGTATGVDAISGRGASDTDAAYYNTGTAQTASIGNRVWLDANANGIQDAGEEGIEGVTVHLLDAAGMILASMDTDADGDYLFDGLAAGDYAVQVVAPAGYFVSPKDAGGNDASDSDIDPTTGKTVTTTLTGGENDMSWDAGLYQKASIGDKVWLDCNANGIQDANEIGVSGVTVNLLSGAGTVLGTTTTDYQGNYLFNNLNPGDYAIQVLAPNGYNFSAKDQGGDDGKDSDVDTTTGKTIVTSLTSGENDLSWDAGLTTVGACLDLSFNGSSATDGTDGNIRTYTQNGLSVNASAFSRDKSTGAWANAWLGTYGGGLGVTDSSEGSGSGNAHTVDNVGGRDNYVMFEFSQTVMLDKAYLGYVIGDSDMQVWIGNFNNPYASHLSLNDAVLSQMGFTEVNATTSSSARWADLNAGDYAGNVIIIAADTTDTTPEDYFKIQTLSVCTPACGLNASLGDTVWLDSNGNGVQDAGEAGISGVSVKLLSSVGAVVTTTTTDSNGNYLFSNLTPGDYAVQVVAPAGYVITAKDQGGNDATDSDFDPTTG